MKENREIDQENPLYQEIQQLQILQQQPCNTFREQEMDKDNKF